MGSWIFSGAEPEIQPTRAAQFVELAKYKFDSLAHARIGGLLESLIGGAHVARRDALDQLAALGFLRQSSLRPCPEVRQLHLADLPFHSQQQPVIGIARIIDSVGVDQQGSHDTAELEQGVPIAAVARQARSLDAEHGTDATVTQSAEHSLEAGPLGAGLVHCTPTKQ